MGNILALSLGQRQELGNGAVNTGYRIILAVTLVQMDIQTTTLYGNTLFQMNASNWGLGNVDTGSLDSITLFNKFLAEFVGKRRLWAELNSVPPNPLMAISRLFVQPALPPEDPVVEKVLTLLASGYFPLKGWWLQFKGNFRLDFGLFQQFENFIGGPADYRIKIK